MYMCVYIYTHTYICMCIKLKALMKIGYLLLVILFYAQFHYINKLVLHLCSTYDFLKERFQLKYRSYHKVISYLFLI